MKSFLLNLTPTHNLNRVGRRLRRSRLFVLLCVFCGYSLSFASGMSSVHSLESGNISLTNTQKNSS